MIISQENQIKILNQKLSKQNEEIEKLETDLAYISSPQKLKELNELEFQLKPILQENIIAFTLTEQLELSQAGNLGRKLINLGSKG